uniref:(R)-mandelonitrile lyase-like n=1 Tax=Tanacetum cinerariifolium TaxID=118510 RepID=A0A6L2LTH6_TANCI|nr:(R)-mandelonitrile lyase-like [Tanacetum cinerariifolium]
MKAGSAVTLIVDAMLQRSLPLARRHIKMSKQRSKFKAKYVPVHVPVNVVVISEIITNQVVRFNYFSNPVSLQRSMNGTRKIRELLRTRAMADYKFWGWYGLKFRFVGEYC